MSPGGERVPVESCNDSFHRAWQYADSPVNGLQNFPYLRSASNRVKWVSSVSDGRPLLHHMVCVIGELLLFLAVLVPSAAAAEPDPFGLPERFSYYLHRTYSWPRMAWLSMDAGVDYAT